MWVMSETGFYSVVEHWDDPQLLLVRSRVRKDLNDLRPYLPRLRVVSTPTADYPYRMIVSRREWAQILESLTRDLRYTNFKDAVERKQGRRRHDTYLAVWSVLQRLEPVRRRIDRMGKQLSLASFETLGVGGRDR